ncbi:hypothetical protein JCM10213v2_002436 [Rhodosporidiobolus nylandii]
MATPDMHDCAVCFNKTRNRCSGCANAMGGVFYCSADCQKLVWVAHKYLCGRSADIFCLPPLSDEEIAQLDRTRRWYDAQGWSFREAAGRFSGREVEDKEMLEYLTSDEDTDRSVRNPLRTFARAQMHRMHLEQDAKDYKNSAPLWLPFSDACLEAVKIFRRHVEPPAPTKSATLYDPYRLLNTFLRRALLLFTFTSKLVTHSAERTMVPAYFLLATRRLEWDLQGTQVSSPIKAALAEHMAKFVEECKLEVLGGTGMIIDL